MRGPLRLSARTPPAHRREVARASVALCPLVRQQAGADPGGSLVSVLGEHVDDDGAVVYLASEGEGGLARKRRREARR